MPDVGDSAEDEEAPSLAAGALIGGKYRVEKLIGQGGMGSVWAAVHVSLGQRVAVKLIARKYASSREARQRFDLEAKAVAQLRSRYVVQVFDHGETEDGTPYIVMEHLEGEPLDQRLERRPLTPAEASPIVTQIARALARAHALGIVHRDLKPENVFLSTSPDGDGEIAKVLDFGIAKIKRADEVGSSTKTGAVMGTPLYMSPEQARALKTVDHRTDLYSLGMVTFAMLTGQPAFGGDSLADLLIAICTAPLPALAAVAPWVPASVSGWFERACARDPAARFQSAEELAEAFTKAVAGAAPPPADLLLRGGTAVVPVPAPAAYPPTGSSGAVQSVTGGGGVHPTTGGFRANPAATSAPFSITGDSIPKRPIGWPVFVGMGIVVVLAVVVAVMRFGASKSVDTVAAAQSPSAMAAVSREMPAPSVAAPSVAAPSVAAPSIAAAPSALMPTRAPVPPIAAAPPKMAVTPPLPKSASQAKRSDGPSHAPPAPAPKSASKNVDLGF